MSIETTLMAALRAKCPRVFVGTAPYGTAMPYVTWQHVGGDPLEYLDNAVASQRNAQIQINTWAATPLLAFNLMQEIEVTLRATPAFVAKPLSEPVGAHDDADVVSGYLQTYSITGAR